VVVAESKLMAGGFLLFFLLLLLHFFFLFSFLIRSLLWSPLRLLDEVLEEVGQGLCVRLDLHGRLGGRKKGEKNNNETPKNAKKKWREILVSPRASSCPPWGFPFP